MAKQRPRSERPAVSRRAHLFELVEVRQLRHGGRKRAVFVRGGAEQLLLDHLGIALHGGDGRAQFVEQLADPVRLTLWMIGLGLALVIWLMRYWGSR